jgi:FMN phosphatase YigB (HAD superfamily)
VSPSCYIFFDVDDTLVEWTISWSGTFAQVAREAGVPATDDDAWQALTTAFTTIYPSAIREHARHADLHEFWADYDGRVLALMGVTGDLRRHAQHVFELLQHPGAIRLYPEAGEVVDTLAAGGARLGILSGRPLAGPDLELLGIRHYFDPVIDAFGVGSVKADGEMFHLAAQIAARCGCVGWHVGDHYQDDVGGARKAGLRPVLIDRRGAHPDADCPRITDLRSLPRIIAQEPTDDPS